MYLSQSLSSKNKYIPLNHNSNDVLTTNLQAPSRLSTTTLVSYYRRQHESESEDGTLVSPRLPSPCCRSASCSFSGANLTPAPETDARRTRTWSRRKFFEREGRRETINHNVARVWIANTAAPSSDWHSCQKSLVRSSREFGVA